MTFARGAAKAIGASDCSAPNGRPGQLRASATGQISWSQMRGRRVEPHWTGALMITPGPLVDRPPAAQVQQVQLAVVVHRRGCGLLPSVLFDHVSFYIEWGLWGLVYLTSTSCFLFPTLVARSLSTLVFRDISLHTSTAVFSLHACIPCILCFSRYPSISHCGPFHRRLRSAANRIITDRRANMDLRSLYAGSPRSLSHGTKTKTDQRQRLRATPDNSYPESMTCSVSTLSSHSPSPAPSLDGSGSPVFDTADYSDPAFVSTDIMSISQVELGPQYQHTSEKPSEAKPSQPQLAAGRPQSLGLPLRMRDETCAEPDTKKSLKRATTHPVRSSSVSVRRASQRAFE